MESIDKFYLDRWSKKDDWSRVGITKKMRLQNFFKFIEHYGIDEKKVKVIDYGCGSGWLFPHLQLYGFLNLNGYDVTPSTLDVVRKKFPYINNIWKGDNNLPSNLPSDSFDLCTSIEVIEHVPKEMKLAILKDINRILKKEGHFYLTTPNGKYFKKGITKEEMQPIEEWLTPKEMKNILQDAGFEILTFGTIRYQRKLSFIHKYLMSTRLARFLKFLGIYKCYNKTLSRLMLGLSMYFFCKKK